MMRSHRTTIPEPAAKPASAAFRRKVGAIIRINVKFLGAFLFGFMAWAMWPEDGYAWWQFRLLSVITGFGAFLTLIDVIKAVLNLQKREGVLTELDRIGGKPKGSALADDDAQRRAGMR
ncbi:hypothetical protein [Rhodobium gokarnense]|uniref:Glucose dehydrogenase n=1 Tax=Rhodobium gokarnense TaxID=364296 RepID=A0ABT3HEL3_9HYPH|nr:hypothetical protein [Rhodobium gokarnense]MCW2308835.1 glucose dehydrogenase [Rhodobium gokarnense]